MDLFIQIAHAATEAATHAPEIANAASSAAGHAPEAAGDGGIVGLFGLNWKLFLAQLINFGIIFFVLWKWVFRPVSKGLSDRTDKIEKSMAEADRVIAERKTFDDWKSNEIGSVRLEAAAIITEAKAGAEKARTEITATAMEESKRIVERGKAQLEEEKNKAVQEIKSEIADMVTNATEAILKKKMDSAADKALVSEAIAELNSSKQTGK